MLDRENIIRKQVADSVTLCLVGIASFFALDLVVTGIFVYRLSEAPIAGAGWLLFVAKPFGLALAAHGLAGAYAWMPRRHRAVLWALTAGVCVLILFLFVSGPFGTMGWQEHLVPVGVAAGGALLAGMVSRRWLGRPAQLGTAYVVALAAAVLLLSTPAASAHGVVPNRLGLVSLQANSQTVQHYEGNPYKDNYPACEFRNNSLGYRDEEPSGALPAGVRRVLVVGDSFVWGDGIPTNEETLSYLIRKELERKAPGQFDLLSAAVPGMGLYGYAQTIDRMRREFGADIVVVGYLGSNDHDPLDPQLILNQVVALGPIGRLVIALGVAQHVHEVSVSHGSRLWASATTDSYFRTLLQAMADESKAEGYRLIFISYFPDATPQLPERIEVLTLGEALRYPNHSSPLWYARDMHPKPALDRILAREVVKSITGAAGSRILADVPAAPDPEQPQAHDDVSPATDHAPPASIAN